MLSRDLFQQHLEKARSNAIGLGPELNETSDGFTDFFDSELFNPFLNNTTRELARAGSSEAIPLPDSESGALLAESLEGERDGLFISDNEVKDAL